MNVPTPRRPITQDRMPKKKPRTITVGIYADDQLALDYEQAEQAYLTLKSELEGDRASRIAQRNAAGALDAYDQIVDEDAARLSEAQALVDSTLAALDEATIWFTFQGLGAKELRELAREHPPTDADQADHARLGGTTQLEWSPDTFPEALVRRACVSPKNYDWDAVFHGDLWNPTEIAGLVGAAISASQSVKVASHRPTPRFEG